MTSAQSAGRLVANRYALLEIIGRGPVSVVWRAWDERAERHVAVKEINLPPVRDAIGKAVLARKLERDARNAVRFSHPGAVKVHDVFDDAGRPFVVTELFAGPTLAQVVAERGPLPAEQAAGLGCDMLETLAAAHAESILHRSIRPENVVVVGAGVGGGAAGGNAQVRAQLSDFAIGSTLVPDSHAADSPFAAPEQTANTGATPAADLWSLGATLHFAVTGHPPGGGSGSPPPSPLTSVLQQLLVADVHARPDADTLLVLLRNASGVSESDAAAQAVDAPVAGETEAGPEAAEEPSPAVSNVTPEAAEASPMATTETEAPAEALDNSGPAETEGATRTTDPPAVPAPPTGPEAGTDPAEAPAAEPPSQLTTRREPWFFPVPVEVVPGSELTLIDTDSDRRPPAPRRGPGRLRLLGLGVLTFGLCLFLVGLLFTRGGSSIRMASPETTIVPSDWVEYADTDFVISRPPDWVVDHTGSATDFRDPSTGAFLRIDSDAPVGASPHDTWLAVERGFAAHNPGYDRVRMVPTGFNGFPASIWEYTYTQDGEKMRAVQLGLRTGRGGYVLRFQAQANQWSRYQPDVAAFESSFHTP